MSEPQDASSQKPEDELEAKLNELSGLSFSGKSYHQAGDFLVIFYDKSAKIFAGRQRLSELAAAGETREVKELRRQIEEATRRAEKAEKEAQALRAQLARAEERAREAEKSAAQARQQERTGGVPDAQMRHYIRQMVQEELRRAMFLAQGFPVEDEPLEETSGDDLLNLVREETGDEYWQEEDEEDGEEPELEAAPENAAPDREEPAGEPEDGGWNLDSIPDSAPTLSEVPPPGHLLGDLRSAFYDRDGNLTWRGRVFYAVAATGACSTGVLWPRVDRNQAGEAVRWLMQEKGLLEEIDPGARSILGTKLFRLSKRGAGIAGGWLQRKLAPCLWDELLRRHNNPAHAMLVLETGGLCNRLEGVLEVDLTPKSLAATRPTSGCASCTAERSASSTSRQNGTRTRGSSTSWRSSTATWRQTEASSVLPSRSRETGRASSQRACAPG
jgi:hypothetical protein